jgi:Zn-dependent M28 family amino/carboxypeptidase
MRNQILIFILIFLGLNTSSFSQKINEKELLEDLQYLSSDALEGRKPLTEGGKMAAQYIKERFAALKLHTQYLDYTQSFTFTNAREQKVYENAANIVGFIPGKNSSQMIVITAHYDHLGKRDELIFNGADDNASGTAALLAFASYFSQNRPNHSIMFVALDAEEMGHQGAKALVKDFPFPLEQVKLNINMDMISRNENNELYAAGTYHYPFLKPSLESVAKGKKMNLLLGHDIPGTGNDDWSLASDHAQFHLKKIPFIYFGVEDHEDYHRPTDTFENIDPDFYVAATQLILNAIIKLDKDLLVRE